MNDIRDAGFHLTAREREILAAVERGMSNRVIARTLVISERTVAVHVSHILAKLGAPNRTSAAVLAVRFELAAQ